jgi:outer membrane protein assembly factor BamA
MKRLLAPTCLFLLFLVPQFLSGQDIRVVNHIVVVGNHRTKEHVIWRELPFAVGDSLEMSSLESWKEKAVQTLTNTSLFNFVEVRFTPVSEQYILCDIKVQERWYIWPGVVFSLAETNFNSWLENKDFDRVNYGLYIQDVNVRGRREILTFNFQYGWKRLIGLSYAIPGINKKRTWGAAVDVYYANNREINYASDLNKRLFFEDQQFIQEEIRITGQAEYRPQLFNKHRIIAGMNAVAIDDTVRAYNPDYLASGHLRSQYLFLNYGFRREKRDNVGYPLRGHMLDINIDQKGFGIFRQGDLMITEAHITFNHHKHLGGRWYLAEGFKAKSTLFNNKSVPYYNQLGLGYGSAFIRGYELNVIDGQHFALWKSNLKYNLVKKRVTDLAMGRSGRFDKFHYSLFLNAFADAGYTVDRININTNPLANNWQYSAGLGLDFVTYYDMVIRLEGSVNKQGVPGFYIHFKNPI